MSKYSVTRTRPHNSADRTEEIFLERLTVLRKQTDAMFAKLMTLQWIAAVVFSVLYAPKLWSGSQSAIHPHVWLAIFLGFTITFVPVLSVFFRPGHAVTRHVVAAGQMLMSGLLIHLTGGRIETHFHIFGGLAFLAFYRDPYRCV